MTATRVWRTVGDLLAAGTATLESAGIDTARVDAEWLLAGVLQTERFAVYLASDRDVPDDLADGYDTAVRRRAAREPLQQILGWEEFRGLRVTVTRDVLVPRPETEMLVEHALEWLPPAGARPALVIDAGTGSGCIACAIARERADVGVVAIDLSPAAIRVAARNAAALAVDRRVRFVVADLLSAVLPASADLVVSNPPYLTSAMLAAAPPEVREHEPTHALGGGADGLAVLRPLIAEARVALKPGGALIVETAGETQVDRVAALFTEAGFVDVVVTRDLAGVRRFIAGRRSFTSSGGSAAALGGGCSKGAAEAPLRKKDEGRFGRGRGSLRGA